MHTCVHVADVYDVIFDKRDNQWPRSSQPTFSKHRDSKALGYTYKYV